MSTFAPPAITVTQPDPFKHVNYTLGMILGEADFRQEFNYLSGRDQWMARGLLGYGTVCGLRVSGQRGDINTGWEIYVEPGAALNPRGQMIRVSTRQCAYLKPWLQNNRSDVLQHGFSPPDRAHLYVVLCYRECSVDPVPIPGEPCRSDDDTRKPSRVMDDYQLELRWEPPEARQEAGIREFVSWLRQVAVTDEADSEANFEAFKTALRTVIPITSPLESPPLSPPDLMMGASPADVLIPQSAIDIYLRAAFLIWTTELRPLWLGKHETCDGRPPDEDCVLLAEIEVPLNINGELNDLEAVVVNDAQRPYLASLRLVQEWILSGAQSGAGLGSPLESGGSLPAPPNNGLPRLVAAARVDANGKSVDANNFSYNNLQVRRVDALTPTNRSFYFMRFDGYDPTQRYIIQAMLINTPTDGFKNIEVVDLRGVPVPVALNTAITNFNAASGAAAGDILLTDLVIRVTAVMPVLPAMNDGTPGLMIEIRQYA